MSATRDLQIKDSWRLRPADLHDIDGLHALEANPLVYRYLFDGTLPDKEYITRLVAQSLAKPQFYGSRLGHLTVLVLAVKPFGFGTPDRFRTSGWRTLMRRLFGD